MKIKIILFLIVTFASIGNSYANYVCGYATDGWHYPINTGEQDLLNLNILCDTTSPGVYWTGHTSTTDSRCPGGYMVNVVNATCYQKCVEGYAYISGQGCQPIPSPCADEKSAKETECGGAEYVNWSGWSDETCSGGSCCPSGRLIYPELTECAPLCLHGVYATPPGFYGGSQNCVSPECGSGEVQIPPENGICEPNCPDGQAFWPVNGTCDAPCEPEQKRNAETRQCENDPNHKCAADEIKTITGLCVKKLVCKENEVKINGECKPVDNACPPGQYRLMVGGQCVDDHPEEAPCKDPNDIRIDGVCWERYEPNQSPDCPQGQYKVNGACVSPDPSTKDDPQDNLNYPDDDGITNRAIDRCPDGQALRDGVCTGGGVPDTYPCPEGSTEQDGECLGDGGGGGEGGSGEGGSNQGDENGSGGGMGEARSMEDSWTSATNTIKQSALFGVFDGAGTIPSGSAAMTYDMGGFGGVQNFDFSDYSNIWAILRAVLLVLVSWSCIKIIFLRGGS